jgi:acetolactate synthase regulatory subunit
MKLTASQTYALQVKADRRAAALERQGGVIKEDDARVKAMFAERG